MEDGKLPLKLQGVFTGPTQKVFEDGKIPICQKSESGAIQQQDVKFNFPFFGRDFAILKHFLVGPVKKSTL